MLSAALLSLVVTASASGSAPIRLGFDATEVTSSFSPRVPDIDPALLQYAPTSPGVALAASLATVGTGVGLLLSSTALLIYSPGASRVPMIAGFAVGALLLDFGPNVGDLLNGDVTRFVRNGLMRLGGSLLLALLGPYGAAVYLGWIALDVANSRNAPARWVARTHPSASRATTPPKPPASSRAPETHQVGLLAFEF